MSGGHFDYAQYRIEDIAEKIDRLIETNDSSDLDEYGDRLGRGYPADIIEKFDDARRVLRLAASMAQRIDWLVSGDDSEELFRRRWREDIEALKNDG